MFCNDLGLDLVRSSTLVLNFLLFFVVFQLFFFFDFLQVPCSLLSGFNFKEFHFLTEPRLE